MRVTDFDIELASASDNELKALFAREAAAGNEERALLAHIEIVRRGLV